MSVSFPSEAGRDDRRGAFGSFQHSATHTRCDLFSNQGLRADVQGPCVLKVMHVKHIRSAEAAGEVDTNAKCVGIMTVHQSGWFVMQGPQDLALEGPNTSVRSIRTPVAVLAKPVTHDANAVMIFAHGMGLASVKSVNGDAESAFAQPTCMAQHPGVGGARVGYHDSSPHHASSKRQSVIGCSLWTSGAKQFIMSEARMEKVEPGRDQDGGPIAEPWA